jgi:hypothetical protein
MSTNPMNLLPEIKDFYHGSEVLTYHCKVKSLTEGDQFLTLKPVAPSSIDSLVQELGSIFVLSPISCVGVIEAEKSLFQPQIQKYGDQFIPVSFFHCHIIAKNSPDILALKHAWVEANEGYVQSFDRKEVYNLQGLVYYFSKQIKQNPSLQFFTN